MSTRRDWVTKGFVPIGVSLLLAGCAQQDGSGGDTSLADVNNRSCLSKIKDFSGNNLSAEKIATHKDAFARTILNSGNTCPLDFADVMKKFEEFDNDGSGGTCKKVDLEGVIVTDRAQLLKKKLTDDPGYRLVMTRACDNRGAERLFFSPPDTIHAGGGLPTSLEVIAFDESAGKTAGVYNYYTNEGGVWRFEGDSLDFARKGVDGDTRECAACHTGGSLNMKELDAPWLNWEGDTTTPGADDIIKQVGDGLKAGGVASPIQKFDGITMESVVRAGNALWNPHRIDKIRKTGTARELLRPLFCTVEINFTSASGASNKITSLGTDYLVDEDLASSSLTMDDATYKKALDALDQHMVDDAGRTISGKIDTIFALEAVKRSAFDRDYVSRLQKVLGTGADKLVKDVLMVDFTRPIFSQQRCGLLDQVPADLKASDATAASIRRALGDKLPASDPADAQKFLDKCEARGKTDKLGLMTDILKVVALARETARCNPGNSQQRFCQGAIQSDFVSGIVEHGEQLPVIPASKLPGPDAHLDPKTCVLSQ